MMRWGWRRRYFDGVGQFWVWLGRQILLARGTLVIVRGLASLCQMRVRPPHLSHPLDMRFQHCSSNRHPVRNMFF